MHVSLLVVVAVVFTFSLSTPVQVKIKFRSIIYHPTPTMHLPSQPQHIPNLSHLVSVPFVSTIPVCNSL